VVGAEILILKDRRIALHQAMGWSDRERLVPLERNSIYRIASMTKPFAGAAALLLWEEGLLDLEDRVAEHLPSFENERSGRITIRQALTHRSGFVQGGEPPGYREQPTLREAVDLIGEAGPYFPPGDRFVYSNLNSETLGALVEALTGQPVEAFLEERILAPLGLDDTHTRFSADAPWAGRVASSYRRWGAGSWEKYWSPESEEDRGWFSPAGDLYGTAFDYARFLALWMDRGRFEGGELLTPGTVTAALADPERAGPTTDAARADPASEGSGPRARYYAMQWEVYAPPSGPGELPVFGHRGASGTLGVAFPEQDVIVVFLTQSQETEVVEEVLETVLEMFGG
jgi:CubicO group peptidase (beta-lactamase class C family)